MRAWAEFLETHPRPHLLVGWTRGGLQWRKNILLQWVAAQRLSGEYSFKRDYDTERERYVIFMAFEMKTDAQELARTLGADEVTRYPGFASQRAFRIRSDLLEKLNAALSSNRSGSSNKSQS